MHKNIKKNFLYQITYRILIIITPLITSPYLSRVLGVESLGRYSASQAYVNYFVLFAMLGVDNYGNRSIAKVQNNKEAREKEFWNIYAIQFAASCLSIIVYIICIHNYIDKSLSILYILQGLCIVSSLLDINWFFFGCEQFKITVTRNIIIKILSVIAILIFVKSPADLWIYILILSGSMVCSQIVLWACLHRYISIRKPELKECRKHIFPIMRLFIPVLASSVFHIMDKTMLNILSDDANSGYYYNADKLINIPLGIVTALSTVLLPRITNIIHTKGDGDANVLLNKSCELLMFISCAISFGIGGIADIFVPLFFGEGYEKCIVLVRCFVPVLIIKAMGDHTRSQYLIPKEKDNLYTIAVFGGAFLNLIANYLLIRRYEALGAVIGTLIAEFIVMLIQVLGVRREIDFIQMFFKQAIYLVFAGIMYLVLIIVENILDINAILKLFVMILAGGFTYLAQCFIYWSIKQNSIFHLYTMKVRNPFLNIRNM